MESVNENIATQHKGKKKLPLDRRRVILSVRVLPSTMEYLKKMGYSSNGRALDVLVKAFQHRGIRDSIDAGTPVDIVNIAG